MKLGADADFKNQLTLRRCPEGLPKNLLIGGGVTAPSCVLRIPAQHSLTLQSSKDSTMIQTSLLLEQGGTLKTDSEGSSSLVVMGNIVSNGNVDIDGSVCFRGIVRICSAGFIWSPALRRCAASRGISLTE